ncbi:queuine tRNA-ribosyltransferase accessory subunit 2 isoform X2 [Lethenteron reissneri]|uniref:queuine tRNA-ribosyltransferase accessory subunit 2 isoform X2 n=1 Tax=Lethenteron reissneri TaxID=7753 RepID=UPI002AB5E4B6|nr:queuine tRNA-ribosyltransferase accessory subunit 2 isoform X2 [Lethenteron reissneri]
MAMRMKLSSVVAGCRVGELFWGEKCLELPACLLYTRGGTAPNLTHDNLELVEPAPIVAQVPLASLAEQQEVLEEYGEGFAKFIGLPDMLLLCTQYDPATPTPQGFTTSKTVSVWGSGGRMELSPSRYVELQRAVRPACYQAPAADDEGPTASSKRERRGVDRTLAFLDACLLAHHTHPELSSVGVLGTVQGGALLAERVRSARFTAARAVDGFLVSGLSQRQCGEGRPGTATRSRILRAVIAELPPDKPRRRCRRERHFGSRSGVLAGTAHRPASEMAGTAFWREQRPDQPPKWRERRFGGNSAPTSRRNGGNGVLAGTAPRPAAKMAGPPRGPHARASSASPRSDDGVLSPRLRRSVPDGGEAAVRCKSHRSACSAISLCHRGCHPRGCPKDGRHTIPVVRRRPDEFCICFLCAHFTSLG